MALNTVNKHINFCILDKYKITKLLCKGSCGKAYLAEIIGTDEMAVVKIIKKIENKTENKIIRDTQIPKLILHKNIVKILDFFENDDFAYVILPYIEKCVCLSKLGLLDLDFTNKDKFEYMINMMIQICNAIEFMHSNFIIHRDIKPQNIIISEKLAILIDFDLAFSLVDSRYPLRNGFIGTPNYAAPEIWFNDKNINYGLCDIYSFGVTLYYIFNKKKLPYSEEISIDELEYYIRYSKPKLSNSGFSVLDKLIMAIINKNPQKRPNIQEIKMNLSKLI